MENIKYKNHNFKKYLTENDISSRISELAKILNKSYKGKNPIVVGVLNGCVFFMMDLLKKCDFDYEISFISAKSYKGAKRGKLSVEEIDESFHDRDIIIVEDIIDTGLTINYLRKRMLDAGVKSVAFATCLLKERKTYKFNFKIDYIGFNIPDRFVVGYGLDLDQRFRGLDSIYTLK